MKCRICKGTELTEVLSLGHHPLSDAFLTKEQLREPEVYYPLDLLSCDECGLVQIGYVVNPEILFQNDYPYRTGDNQAGVEHFRELAKSVVSRFRVELDDLVVDIGGNDGTLLEGFRCRTLNIDPSGLPARVKTVKAFWGPEIARKTKFTAGNAKVITATNVFAHCNDLHEFMKGIDILLAQDGVFIIEAPALECLLENDEYDTIYHEHLSYLSPKPISYLVSQYGMTLFDVERYPIHGGTDRYFIRRVQREGTRESQGVIEFTPQDKGEEQADCGCVCACKG